MENDNLFMKVKPISEYVTEFKKKIIKEFDKHDVDILEIELEKVKKFFKYQPEKDSKWLWLPKRFRDEMLKQGVHIKKKRGYSTAYITLDDKETK